MFDADNDKLDQLVYPEYSFCMRCQKHWDAIDPHWIDYTCGGFKCGGLTALCKECWMESSVDERLLYYRKRWNLLDKKFPDSLHWLQIKSIILSGNIDSKRN